MQPPAPARAAPQIAVVAALFADPSRARMLAALTDGRSLPASVLAAAGGVAASTASEHLGRLVHGGVLAVEQSGRHRYYRLAGPEIGAVLEQLAALAPQPPVRSLRESTRAAALRRSRSCYDHLAGRLGVAVTDALLARGALVRTDGRTGTAPAASDPPAVRLAARPYRLGPQCEPVCRDLGIELAEVQAGRRELLRFCIDWSEQRHHLAGALGAAVFSRLLSAGWVRRRAGQRALDVTAVGRAELLTALGVTVEAG